MNKKNNRKGFTIVELVIVIAVIAILATVLVPTFGNVIEKANITAAKQEAKSLHTNYVMECVEDNESYVNDCWVLAGDYYVQIVDGGVVEADSGIVKAEESDFADGTKILTADGTDAGEDLDRRCEGVNANVDAKKPCDWCGFNHLD